MFNYLKILFLGSMLISCGDDSGSLPSDELLSTENREDQTSSVSLSVTEDELHECTLGVLKELDDVNSN